MRSEERGARVFGARVPWPLLGVAMLQDRSACPRRAVGMAHGRSSSRACRNHIALLTFAFVFSCPAVASAAPFSFDDIDFWVGTGANRAAIVIDWSDESTQPAALAWGFRWDGSARGRDMLAAVVATDPQLFAKLGGTRSAPNAVYGLGYDADHDGVFSLDDNTAFDAEGFEFTGPSDGAASNDADDCYAEGWFTGFWHYGVAASNPYAGGAWGDTLVGMAGRVLTDGSWDSWTFSPSFDFTSYAMNPQAAQPPGSKPGDFNGDGDVDDDDYAEWRSTYGSESDLDADISGNQRIDAADYVLWRIHADATSNNSASVAVVPEPTMLGLFLFITPFFLFRNTNRH